MTSQFHPRSIATTRAHERRRPGSCASDDSRTDLPCSCRPNSADLAEVWEGRVRMARARRDAGQPLDDVDRQALERSTRTGEPQ